MLSRNNKVLLAVLGGILLASQLTYLSDVFEKGTTHASVISDRNEYSDLTVSYVRVEMEVGDSLDDFVVDYKGKTVTNYTIKSVTNSFQKSGNSIRAIAPGEGELEVNYLSNIVKIPYVVKGEVSNSTVHEDTPESAKYITCRLTANNVSAKGVILYIDDPKNAFKTTGEFYIEESFLTGSVHAIYVAKFTRRGPVAYKLLEFTSLAGEINFMNYDDDILTINGTNIDIKTALNNLF